MLVMAGIRVKDQTQRIGPGVVRRNLPIDVFSVVAIAGDRFRAAHQARADGQLHGVEFLLRIDPAPALRDPLGCLVAPTVLAVSGQIDRTLQHGLVHPGPPDRPAQLVHQHPVLQGFAAPAEFQESCPDRGIVHLREVPCEHFVGNAHGRRHGAELLAHEFGIRRPDIRRCRELDIFTRLQDLQGAGFHPGQGYPLGVGRRLAHQVVFRRHPGDEAGEHGGGLLPHQLGIVVLVQLVEFHERPGEPGFAPDLAGA